MRDAVRAQWPLEAVFIDDRADLDFGGLEMTPVAPGVLERVATTVTPRPVVAVGRQRVVAIDDLRSASFVVVLVDVADPGNAGTILRSAEAAGADGVVVCGGVDVFNPKCVRASAGSLFFLPIAREPDAVRGLETMASWGMCRIGTSAAATQSYDAIDLRGPVGLVFGSEAHGLAAEVERVVDHVVSIPIVGQTESLNVAGAAAVAVLRGGPAAARSS